MTNPKHTDTSRSDLEERWREAERNRLVDRIEALEAEIERLREALEAIADGEGDAQDIARQTLEGDSHD